MASQIRIDSDSAEKLSLHPSRLRTNGGVVEMMGDFPFILS
jgi:hypothetical protein